MCLLPAIHAAAVKSSPLPAAITLNSKGFQKRTNLCAHVQPMSRVPSAVVRGGVPKFF